MLLGPDDPEPAAPTFGRGGSGLWAALASQVAGDPPVGAWCRAVVVAQPGMFDLPSARFDPAPTGR